MLSLHHNLFRALIIPNIIILGIVTIFPGTKGTSTTLNRRDYYECNHNLTQERILNENEPEGINLAIYAIFRLNQNGTDAPFYSDYFGPGAALEAVRPEYTAIVGNSGPYRVVDHKCARPDQISESCSDTPSMFSVIEPNHAIVYACPSFFNAPREFCNPAIPAESTRRALLLHQLLRARNQEENLVDIPVTCEEAKTLPDSQKAKNTANYVCFAIEASKFILCK